MRKKELACWAGLVCVFILALLPRLIYPVSRPGNWYKRSGYFWEALLERDWAGTYLQYHPGVTTMWVAGFGLRVYMATHGWSLDDLFDPPPTPSGLRREPIEAGVAALSLVIAACIGLAYVLMLRLANWWVAFSAGCMLALDPFYIAQSKIIHVDALMASLMLVSALFLVGYLQQEKRWYLVSSGVFAGLAFLTKSSSGLLVPCAVLVVVLRRLREGQHTSEGSPDTWTWRRGLWEAVCDLGVWGLVGVGVFLSLWPAMWVMPGEVLSMMADSVLFHVETAHRNPNFFAGRLVYGDPGPLYYVAALAWKTTLITLPASCAAVLFLLVWRRRGRDRGIAWWSWIYAGFFFLMMMLAAKKGLRYILPTFLGLDVLAAWGLVQVAGAVGRWWRLRSLSWVPAAVIATGLFAQAGLSLRHHPYYGTHHNLLLGDSRVAQHILPLGDQGEGLDLAARFLSGYSGAELITAGVQQRGVRVFQRNFLGHVRSIADPDVDYRVFAINSNQRELNIERWGEIWEAYQGTEPLWSVSFDGVPYVWIYRAYPHDPETFAIEHRLDVQLGDHIRLLGYRTSSSELSAGDTLTVTLFWQSDGELTGDYHVFAHLLSMEGQLVAQHDGVPGQGEQPTWNWRDAEVLQDEHRLNTDGLPDGTYALSVGMYDFLTGSRLPAVTPVMGRLPEDRVLLEDIQVGLP